MTKKIKPEKRMMQKENVKRSCNQCFSNLKTVKYNGIEQEDVGCCVNPACPSYSLLQISAEKMPKEELTLSKLKSLDKKFFKEKSK